MDAFVKSERDLEIAAFQQADDIKIKKNQFGGYWIYPVKKVSTSKKVRHLWYHVLENSLRKTVRFFIWGHLIKKKVKQQFMGPN